MHTRASSLAGPPARVLDAPPRLGRTSGIVQKLYSQAHGRRGPSGPRRARETHMHQSHLGVLKSNHVVLLEVLWYAGGGHEALPGIHLCARPGVNSWGATLATRSNSHRQPCMYLLESDVLRRHPQHRVQSGPRQIGDFCQSRRILEHLRERDVCAIACVHARGAGHAEQCERDPARRSALLSAQILRALVPLLCSARGDLIAPALVFWCAPLARSARGTVSAGRR
jgi:hypothetical protein